MSLTLSRTDLLKEQNFIDGQRRPCLSGSRHEVLDPATGTAFAGVPDSAVQDAQMAAASALQLGKTRRSAR